MRSDLESKDLNQAILGADITKASVKAETSMFDATCYKEKLNENKV